ncbi:MAG: hypothetical protein A2849_02490 [Candidatus Taylorbacteria bacterium RIFCSPHIGHO2_01_FULL_51_15]|uniref:Type 4 fimbrial biogenesis protein PilX N-terminal domain-containing protein n=1 Tax=Candidatus Taylorbacteria bacterium RIFCSPHIGHO2_01_FULL_51_15 TaxID=1802304 RepID=A0A1G2MCL1_9BACT|nr:MAG: hypothetical protein A2849_02490 [Candidatus Taylorbacteria bacterium RIFCSPHIGHO2_01_FULL_51_15]
MNNELRIKEGKLENTKFSWFSHTSYFILHTSSQRGFTLLFAVLIGSLLFSVGIAIAHLSLKEIVLSSAGKESEKAFFAADTGTECALYWDRREGIFPNTAGGSPPSLRCAGADITAESVIAIQGGAATTFTVPPSGSPCAEVIVYKTDTTIIESRGRSECGTGVNPARVERALRVRY